MKPDRFLNLKINDLGLTEDGTPVLVTNTICTLPHENTEVYQASHGDGCLMTPFEGLVFTMNGPSVAGWSMMVVTGWPMTKGSDEMRDSIRDQMLRILEEDMKREKARRRKRRPVW